MRLPCVYYIKNTVTNDLYIGSCLRFNIRMGEHLRTLFRKTHHNIHLQRAWNKYSCEKFVYGVYEILPHATNDELRAKEQIYLDQYCPAYNISPDATRNIMSKEAAQRASEREAKDYVVKDPSGKEYAIRNLTKFCLENDLSENGMRSVLYGASSNHRGWKCRKPDSTYRYINKHTKTWIVVSPYGKRQRIENLSRFCRENHLTTPSMQKVAYGQMSQHKGWRCQLISK